MADVKSSTLTEIGIFVMAHRRTDIDTALEDAFQLATEQDTAVVVEFNRYLMKVDKNTKIKEVASEYRSRFRPAALAPSA